MTRWIKRTGFTPAPDGDAGHLGADFRRVKVPSVSKCGRG